MSVFSKRRSSAMKQAIPKIVGNEALRQRLISDVLCGSLSHAYIIEGANGSGRKTIALNTAAATACERLNDASFPAPCGECPSCKKILGRKSPDVIFIKDENKSTVGVDVARFIRENVRVVPNDIEDKFYVI
jgi:DNA polymerase-3 subunit delta'